MKYHEFQSLKRIHEDGLKQLQSENERLKKQNKILKEGLEFYEIEENLEPYIDDESFEVYELVETKQGISKQIAGTYAKQKLAEAEQVGEVQE